VLGAFFPPRIHWSPAAQGRDWPIVAQAVVMMKSENLLCRNVVREKNEEKGLYFFSSKKGRAFQKYKEENVVTEK
jgi:hypothetical protein